MQYSVKEEALLLERSDYLKKMVNSLVIQILASGNIPKIKSGIPMSIENLLFLKKQLESHKCQLTITEEEKFDHTKYKPTTNC